MVFLGGGAILGGGGEGGGGTLSVYSSVFIVVPSGVRISSTSVVNQPLLTTPDADPFSLLRRAV